MIGTRIAHYEITGRIAEGGLGQVYRARDSRLGRDVAIKLLPEHLARDPSSLSRFRREAEVLASLSHGNIGHIYGIEESGDSLALVLELIDGQTLAERLAHGPLPQPEALRIAVQIAAALEAAHERQIVHRDLKPGNVMLTSTGDAKVLDFGLAKELRLDGADAKLTQSGMVLGTPTYMSPEQARGQDVDRRTDVWSFGCVLYEMLAGRPPFEGESLGDLFAAICTAEPDLSRIAGAPPPVRRLVERCLRKDVRTRLRDMGDVRIELEDVVNRRSDDAWPAAPASEEARRSHRGALVAAGIAGLVLGALGLWALDRKPPARAAPVVSRYAIPLPEHSVVVSPTGVAPPLAISPDGGTISFAGKGPDGVQRLFVRGPRDLSAAPIEGTEGAELPFFSYDGAAVGMARNSASDVARLSLDTKRVETIARGFAWRGGTWCQDGSIVVGVFGGGLHSVDVATGADTPLTELGSDEVDHSWPQALPGGREVLFTAAMRGGQFQTRVLDLRSGDVTRFTFGGRVARYVTSGHIVYARSNELWAIRYDADSRTMSGAPQRVLTGVYNSDVANPHFAISPGGVLVYETVRGQPPGRRLVWVDRETGTATELAEG